MKAIVVLFKKRNFTDSEAYLNANIEKFKVSVEETPNSLFSQGLVKSNIYDEAKRLFGSINQEDNIDKIYLLKDKYALTKLVASQPAVLLEVTKKATTEEMVAHIFLIVKQI